MSYKNISKTLIIGLGGTGQCVIREIKKKLLVHYGEIPPAVKFLAFDTSSEDYQETPFKYCYHGENKETLRYNLQLDEFVELTRPSLDILHHDVSCANLNYEQLTKFYAGSNCCARVIGRAHFLHHSGFIIQTLMNAIVTIRATRLSEAQQAKGYQMSADNDITVCIIASLAGGTGSSAILDMARMVQHAGINRPLNSEIPIDRILGFFFLPSFFEKTSPNTPFFKSNTYVALSELDYVLGLNDHIKYPEGCVERDNDRNTYGGFNSYKPVDYSNVYLIDNKTRMGNSNSFEDAVGNVAAFISASMAADIHALDFNASVHCFHTADGKNQRFSGLGSCEICFNRQSLVNYLLDKSIRDMLTGFKSGDGERALDKDADQFISENDLNEGVMWDWNLDVSTNVYLNRLTDSIYTLDDNRFKKPMNHVGTGKDAAPAIEHCKNDYLNGIISEARNAIENFSSKREQLEMNLRTLLDDHQCKRGFENFPYLAKRLKKAFSEMKAGLETEVVHLKDSYSDIEKKLHSLECTIADNIPKMLFSSQRKKVQGAAIMSYISMVEGIASKEKPTLMRLTLEMMRKEEAVKVYERLIDIIDPYYKEERKDGDSINASGSFINIRCYFDNLWQLVDTQFHSFKPSESDDKWVVSVDAIFKEYFDTHPNEAFELAQSDQSSLDNYFQDLLSNRSDMNDGLLAEIRERLLKQIPEHALINRIAREEISLDELLIECFGKTDTIEDYRDYNRYPHLRIFTRINSLLDVMWQYEPFHNPGSQPTAKQIIVGVHDQRAHLFDHHNGYDSFLDKTASYWFVQFGDPDRIVFLIQEIAIPAFKLSDAKKWAEEYNARKDTFYAFSDTRLEDIDMIMPNNCEIGDIEKE